MQSKFEILIENKIFYQSLFKQTTFLPVEDANHIVQFQFTINFMWHGKI